MIFTGPARLLSATDVSTIAGYLGCEIACIQALLLVESAGRGFGPDGRPVILNEPHVFYRELKGEERARAVQQGLAYKTWGSEPYLETQLERYAWLYAAMKINETAALRSCSWGLGQVMGFNSEACGFPTVQDFVEVQPLSEGAHLYTMARFIVYNKLQRYLRRKTWRSFAKGYNGAGYEKNKYHTKLENAYDSRPDTEKVVPPPATEEQLFALIVSHEPPTAPRDVPEPNPGDLREAQPNQPPPKEPHPMAALVTTAVLVIMALVLAWFLMGG